MAQVSYEIFDVSELLIGELLKGTDGYLGMLLGGGVVIGKGGIH